MDELLVLRVVSRILIVLTTVCYLYQILYLLIPLLPHKRSHKAVKLHRYAILVPARNEETVLPHLLDSIHAQDYPQELLTVYVIADNCTDRTAEVARAHGAQVFTRFNRVQIGKGYALHALLEQIENNGGLDRYDAFLVFDADNLLKPDYITQINRTCSDGYDAFCGFRNTKNYGCNWLTAGYGLWYIHESTHLNRSRMRIGTSCAVSGTGFGFTRQLLERCGGWNYFTLTEDLEFNAWCATHGERIGYCHDAISYDEQPLTFPQSWRQRTRWAQGGIQVSVRYAGHFLRGILKGGRTAYASFETATLSLWGCGITILSAVLEFLLILLETGWLGLIRSVGLALIYVYLSMFMLGALTMAMEWSRIRASAPQKLGSLFTFPLFMMTFVPITLAAPFQKFGWAPIAHTVAISAKEMQD